MHATATATLPAPEQPSLLGIDLAARAPQLVRWSLVGEIKRHAEVRIATDGSAHLVVQVLQPKGALPFLVAYHAPSQRRAELQQMALRMLPGAAVLVVGRGFRLVHRDDYAYLAPIHCDNLIPASEALAATLDACAGEPEIAAHRTVATA